MWESLHAKADVGGRSRVVAAHNSVRSVKIGVCADCLIVAGMLTILSAMISLASFRFRRRVSRNRRLLALRHQLTVIRRQRPADVAWSRRPLALELALANLASLSRGDVSGQGRHRAPVAQAGLTQILALTLKLAACWPSGCE